MADVVPEAITRLEPELRARLSVVQQAREEDLSRTREAYAAFISTLQSTLDGFGTPLWEEKTAADYGVDVMPRLEILSTREPEGRQAGIKVGSVDELVSKLKEAGVI